MSRAAEPLTPADFADRLQALVPTPRRLALAVSGGRDSTALLLLAAAYRDAAAPSLDITALTVDHGLRPESRAEAEAVEALCDRLGVAHRILRWRSGPEAISSGNLQAAAREARYALMRDWRRAAQIGPLATGHTRDDVAETFLMRLARGSGVDGLAQMPALRVEDAAAEPPLTLIRPLLDVPRTALEAVCRAAGVDWSDDPSNADPRFDRVKARRALAALEPLGLGPERLAKTAATMARARGALETATREALAAHAQLDRTLGICRLDLGALAAAAPREIVLRAVADLLRWTAAAPYPPRLDGLMEAVDALAADGPGRTLHGCVLTKDGAAFVIAREAAATPPPRALDADAQARALDAGLVWDGRFRLRLEAGAPIGAGWRFGALGAQAARGFAASETPAAWRAAPPGARAAAPALFAEDGPIAAPAAGLTAPGVAILPEPRGALVEP